MLLPAVAVRAQVSQGPGVIERTIPLRPPEIARPAPIMIVPPIPISPSQAISGRFVLGAVSIEGATIFSQETLAKAFEPYLATEIDETTLKLIAKRITERYRAAGYLLSFAFVPRQEVRAGIVRIVVVEGRVGSVVIEGAGRDRPAIDAIAHRLLNGRPLKLSALERTLGLIRDLPNFVVTDASLAPTNDPAIHRLRLVVGHDRVRQLLYADNRGPQGSDRTRLYSSTSVTSALIAGDELRLELFAIPTERYRYLYGLIAASLPIGHGGLRLGLSGSHGTLKQRRDGARIDGGSSNVSAQLSYPIVHSRAWRLAARGVISDLSNDTSQNAIRIERDRLRVVRGGVDFAIDGQTRISGEAILSRGIGFGGATRAGDALASRPGAGGRFTKAALNLQMAHRFSQRFAVSATIAAQVADRRLLVVEQFALGGNRLGRAYDYNALTGDIGLAGGVELAYRLRDPRRNPRPIELFAFSDGGVVGQVDCKQRGCRRGLASVGVGSRLVVGGVAFAGEMAVPLVSNGNGRPIRGFFAISRTF